MPIREKARKSLKVFNKQSKLKKAILRASIVEQAFLEDSQSFLKQHFEEMGVFFSRTAIDGKTGRLSEDQTFTRSCSYPQRRMEKS